VAIPSDFKRFWQAVRGEVIVGIRRVVSSFSQSRHLPLLWIKEPSEPGILFRVLIVPFFLNPICGIIYFGLKIRGGEMAVRSTESKLPLALPGDPSSGDIDVNNLGQAVRDGNYVLVSYLSSPLIQDSRNDWVVFVLKGAAVDQYHWSVTNSDSGDEVRSSNTDAGIFSWTPDSTGEYEISVAIKSGGAVAKTLKLHQTVLSINPGEGLDQLFPFEMQTSAAGFWPLNFVLNLIKRAVYAGEWDSTGEVLFELWGYILEAASSTGPQGIPAQLLAALIYQQVLTHPKEFSITRPIYIGPAVRSTELEWAAEDLNQPDSFRLTTQIDDALGVGQIPPQTAAMLLGYTQWREKPEERKDRKAVDEQIHADFVALPADTKVELFNLLRFPKTNINLAAKLLTRLKSRKDPMRWPQLTQQQLMTQDPAANPQASHEDAILLVTTEYYIGAVKTPSDRAMPNSEACSVLKSMKDTYIKPFFRQHDNVDPLYGGCDLTHGFPNANPAVQADSDTNHRYGGVNNKPVPPGTHYIADLRADLQLLGFCIHSEQAAADPNLFDLKLLWAVREFQIYSKMNFIALDRDQLPANPDMTNRLRRYPNLFRYSGPVSGVVNHETRRRIRVWKAVGWRCPVIISAWTIQGGRRAAAPFQRNDNVWNFDAVAVGGPNRPTFFAQDYTGYYSNIPQNRLDGGDPTLGNGFMVLGKYAAYSMLDANNQPMIFGGPVSEPPNQTWPEAELLPVNLTGRDLYLQQPDPGSAALLAQRSTYKVVRAVAEQECIGFFDSLNAYDNAFLSQGPCHWTLGIVFRHPPPAQATIEMGELCAYLSYLKHKDPDTFSKTLGFFGADITLAWGNDGAALFVAGQRKYTAWLSAQQEDRSFSAFSLREEEGNFFKTWHWFYRFAMAGRTIPGYRQWMWAMARIRLRDIGNTPWPGPNGPFVTVPGGGHRPALIKEVYTSERAMALLMRWHVKWPARVVRPGNQTNQQGQLINLARAFSRSQLPNDLSQWPADPEPALIQGIMDEVAPPNNDPDNYSLVRDWPKWETRDNVRGFALDPARIDLWSEAWTDAQNHARVRRLKTARNSFLFWDLQPDEG
jgi:hypothetical protein